MTHRMIPAHYSNCQSLKGVVSLDCKRQCHVGSGRPRATADRKDRLIIRSTVTAPDLSLSTIRRVTRTLVSTLTIHKRQIERNLRSYQSLRYLPLTPAHCRAMLKRYLARSGWNSAD
ncbi:HTH_Tnp_Tc3_2 domain-containing protein [Trichonephila clavipes]|nr:HTH_Tnp_Tc3_2 domain-containing protein [Trichonephila clavipes]